MKSYSSPAGGTVDQATASQQSAANDVVKGLLIEAGVILSMACAYLVGNSNLGSAWIFRLNPLYALPFVLLFVVLCWYRLDFAVALFPLTLPYTFVPKPLYAHGAISLAELTLLLCLGVAVLQLAWQRKSWRYRVALRDLYTSPGPWIAVVLLLAVAALWVALLAPGQQQWETLRLVVIEPVIYVGLMLLCLQARARIERVLWALFVAGCVVSFSVLVQAIFFPAQLPGGGTIGTTSQRFVRVFLDALFPLCLAFCLLGTWQGPVALRSWTARLAAGFLCLLLLLSLFLLGMRASVLSVLVACACVALSFIRGRRVLAWGAVLLCVVCVGLAVVFLPGLSGSLAGGRGLGDLLRDFPGIGSVSVLTGCVLVLLCGWIVARMLSHLSASDDRAYMRWIVIGLGGVLAVALLQALMDTMVVAQGTWYLCWACVGALLLLQHAAGVPRWGKGWRARGSGEVHQVPAEGEA